MNDDIRNIVLGLVAAGISGTLGWLARTARWRRRLARMQDFFGLPANSQALLVVNRQAGQDGGVRRFDVFALLELSGLIKDCGAQMQVVWHDGAHQGVGEQTEFCVGGPVSNRRVEAHLRILLPGVRIDTEGVGPHLNAYRIGSQVYGADRGTEEYALLARVTPHGQERPVFLLCGQRSINNQAAARYLARHHGELARAHGKDSFCLLLRVVNSDAYGPDVVELVADVTTAARTAPVAAADGSG
ncbi:hypothetical protein [Streptomyces sp. NPDC048057]|uniref:hypothetical protein n=1 Tax=Streptomyces sp. NPDC048057 TaxID=3155628 RepID=UPI0033EC0E56